MGFIKATRKKAGLRPALSGAIFNRLTAIDYAGPTGKENRPAWNCTCACGNKVLVMERHLISGHTRSCGCIKSMNALRHGQKPRAGETRTYTSWQAMMQRCYDGERDNFALYGGRGIVVCEQWRSFAGFFADMGMRPCGMTLDRKDVNKNYEPGNCKWSTDQEQANNKRTNLIIDFGGESKTLAQWAVVTGTAYACLHKRLFRLNWSIDRALSTKSRKAA